MELDSENSEVKLLKSKELQPTDFIAMDSKKEKRFNREEDLYGDKKWVESLVERFLNRNRDKLCIMKLFWDFN